MSTDTADLIESLLAGQPIDWNRAGGHDPAFLDALHTLEEVHNAYRRIGAGAPAQPVLFQWGPLAVHEKIALGASAEVYRAWDAGLATTVALKLLRPEAAVAGLRSHEFLREARLLARIGQRNVVRVYGAAVHDGRPGLWAEWIDGRTLADIVAGDGPLAPAEAAYVGRELCQALAAIHAAGLIHGDVKASNVLRERGGRIVLADLGAGGSAAALEDSLRTQATPAYLSPQAQAGAPRSAADDLYALGVLLRFLVTGRHPATASDDLRLDAPGIDPAFAQVLARACAADPAARHPSAVAFADALGGISPAAAAPRVRRVRRGWLALAAAALLALAAVGTWQATQPLPWEATATLLRHGADVALHDGDGLRLGDRLRLEVAGNHPTWAYVLNEDEVGAVHVLFPLDGLAQVNPLPHGRTQLPGSDRGRALSWEVSSAGGREEFLVILADQALATLEANLATLAGARVEAPRRGVGKVSALPLSVSVEGASLRALLEASAADLADPAHVRIASYRFATGEPVP